MLDMYHRHLPHSGGQVYSDVLEQGLDQIGNVILLSDLINCSTWNILDDVRRLAHFSAGTCSLIEGSFDDRIGLGWRVQRLIFMFNYTPFSMKKN